MRRDDVMRRLDPADISSIERAASGAGFVELRRHIMAGLVDSRETVSPRLAPPTRRHPGLAAASVVAVAILVAGGFLVFGRGGGGLKGPFTTRWHAAAPLPRSSAATSPVRTGTWKLVGTVVSGTWQQDPYGPPPGYLTCPSDNACYTLSAHYASDSAAQPLSESIYSSTDAGSTWSELPMPAGFVATSALSCDGPNQCAVGGTYEGQPVLATTNDGGHSLTVHPLPAEAGELFSLSCATAGFCAGLAAPAAWLPNPPVDATLVATSDGGSSFVDRPIIAGDSMLSLSCSSSLECTAVGTSDSQSANDDTAGVVGRTTDGGRTWVPGALPVGFGTASYDPQLSCADATHCFVVGNIAINEGSLAECAGRSGQVSVTVGNPNTSLTLPGPQLRPIAEQESRAATQANLYEAKSVHMFTCSNGPQVVSDIASSSDGGLTWTPDALPSDAPEPQLNGLACPTPGECWAAGSDTVPEHIGNSVNGGSSVLLGTIDGGSTWSRTAFSVPAGAPNYAGQSYLSIGSVSCPSSGVCVALGMTAQSSPTAPVYSLVTPGAG